MSTLLIKNIGRLQTPVGSFSHRGKLQRENLKLDEASILIENGIIKSIVQGGKLPCGPDKADEVLDAQGNLVTPGLIDGHTHLVFGGYRQNEILMKLAGATYIDILKSGGGILDTVVKTREATMETLYEKSKSFLNEMLSMGVTSCEIKSGYGLNLETELKCLEIISQLSKKHPMDIVATYMGAHAVPPEYEKKSNDFIEKLVRDDLPKIKESGLAAYTDIFCETGVFSEKETRKYMKKAKELGFKLRVHADEIEEIGGSILAGKMRAVSAEHLIAIGEKGLDALEAGGTIAMLLPATSFYLDKPFAPARKMIEKEIPVAMASDFNPGSCPSLNLQLVINLGYLKYNLFPEEILTAVTINPACALGIQEKTGTIEEGKQADLVIWNAPDFEMLCYRFGSNLALKTIKKGKII